MRVAIVTAIAAAALLSNHAPAAAADTLTATVAPGEVALAPGGSANGVLVVANGGAAALRVKVAASASDESVAIRPPRVTVNVPANGSLSLPFRLTRSGEGTGQDVDVSFLVSSGDHIALATSKVTAAAAPEIVQAEIKANLGTIDENRPGEAALVVANPRQSTLHVSAIDVHPPAEVNVTLHCPGLEDPITVTAEEQNTRLENCSFDVAARSERVIDITLNPTDAVAPGPRLLLVFVEASDPVSHAGQTVVASTTATVDVFGESDILKGVGVPVFILLPGVIVLLASWFLITKASPWRRGTTPTLSSPVQAATFTAVTGLGVSLVIAKLYPWLTELWPVGARRDYLRAYGFRDFYIVFGYSFAIAVLVWLCSFAAFWADGKRRALFEPSPDDDPVELLRKIGLRGLLRQGTTFRQVKVASGAEGTLNGLQLRRRFVDDKLVVVPALEVTLRANAPDGLRATIEKLVEDEKAFELWQTVDRALKAEQATIAYRPQYVGAPDLVTDEELKGFGGRVPAVSVRAQ